MTPILKKGTVILWGTVTRDTELRQTKSGRPFTTFSMKYDRHHNEDGQMVNEYMNVTIWGEDAKFIGDEDVGIAKGDTIVVFGQLVEDTYRKEGEDPDIEKWRVFADVIIDMTSIFQVAQMVVGGSIPQPEPSDTKSSKFTETREKTPFQEELEDDDTELPY